VKISVTEEDIKSGVKMDCNKCAIANALARQFATQRVEVDCEECISVGGHDFWIPDRKERSMVGKFITDFDSGLTVTPIEFELENSVYGE